MRTIEWGVVEIYTDSLVVAQFDLDCVIPSAVVFSGGARDLASTGCQLGARSLGPPVKARAFGMTHRVGFSN
jgi:hypothetical protein